MAASEGEGSRPGRYIVKAYGEETVRAFVPPPLPPHPRVRLEALQRLLEQANQSLGRLDGLASVLPNLPLFIYAYVRKEAVLSSQIEGTQSSLCDLLARSLHVLGKRDRGGPRVPRTGLVESCRSLLNPGALAGPLACVR